MGLAGETEQEVKEFGEAVPEDRRDRVFLGTPEQIAEQLHDKVLGTGIDGITINLIRNGHRPASSPGWEPRSGPSSQVRKWAPPRYAVIR